jgi:uncharacterized spore protein YtfJ
MGEAKAAGEAGLIERLIEAVGGRAGSQAVFAPPVQRGGVTVIPVARVRWGAGGGRGWSPEQGDGSGGGGGAVANPVGYIEVTEHGSAFRPIERPLANPLMVLAGAVGIAIVLRALARVIRS